jgi:hypothetical protein
MNRRIALLTLLFVLGVVPTFAFEPRPSEERRRLRLELETTPSRVQHDFDRYVAELTAAARRDALYGDQARRLDEARNRERKVLNPIALFRW